MNGFYVGLLVFPLSIAALGIAVGSVMWALNRLRAWSEQSTARLDKSPQMPEAIQFSPGFVTSTVANMHGRDVLVQLIATSRRVKLISFSSGTGIILVDGGAEIYTPEEKKVFRKSFDQAVQDFGVELSKREKGIEDPAPKDSHLDVKDVDGAEGPAGDEVEDATAR